MVTLATVILTTLHFLYYCRAVKFVGPFVLMVYTIITRDMIRFFMIYFIFLIGFSQGLFQGFASKVSDLKLKIRNLCTLMTRFIFCRKIQKLKL